MTWFTRDPSAISPTALYTGEVWARNGLGYPALSGLEGCWPRAVTSRSAACTLAGSAPTSLATPTSADGEIDPRLVSLFDKLALTSSDAAARTILRGAAKGKARILVGPDAHAMDLTIRILGARYQRPLAWVAGRAVPQWFRPGTDG